MGFLKTLFGSEKKRLWMIPGIVSSVSKDEVLKRDTSMLEGNLDMLAGLSVKHGKLFFLELTFQRFIDDPRPVFAIPEIVMWTQKAKEDLLDELAFWLTPGSRMNYYLSINATWWKQLPNGSHKVLMDHSGLTDLAMSSSMSAYTRLKKAGVGSDVLTSLAFESAINTQEMLKGKIQLGSDYGVAI